MIKRHTTKYEANGKRYATAWDQLNKDGKIFIFNQRTIEI